MKEKKIIRLRTVLIFISVLGLYGYLSPYWMWATFQNGRFAIPSVLLTYTSLICMFVYQMLYVPSLKLRKELFFTVILWGVFAIYVNFCTLESNISIVILLTPLYILFFDRLYESDKKFFFECVLRVFILFSVPSIIYFLFQVIGIPWSDSVIQSLHSLKAENGISYLHGPLGIVMRTYLTYRPCGVFDEPGVMGTIAGLLFSAIIGIKGKYRIEKITLIAIGTLSTSFAFFIIIAIAILIHAYQKGSFKLCCTIVVLLLVYFIFMNIHIDNSVVTKLQSRFTFVNGALSGDNRTNDAFKQEFSLFVSRGGAPLILGNGNGSYFQNANLAAGSSYKCLIYEYGVIGFGLLIVCLGKLFRELYFNQASLIFFVPFICSIYQRPFIATPYFILLLMSSLSIVSIYGREE